MRYSLLAGGKRLRPISAWPAPMRSAARARRRCPRLRHRADSHLLADPRRPAGHGQRHAAARPADAARRRRRRDGHSRRRWLLTEAFALLAREPAPPTDRDRRRAQAAGHRDRRRAAGPSAWSADRRSIWRRSRPTRAASPPLDDAERARAMHARKTGALIRVGGGGRDHGRRNRQDQVDAIDARRRVRPGVPDRRRHPRRRGRVARARQDRGKDAAGKPTYPALYGLDAARHGRTTAPRRSPRGADRARCSASADGSSQIELMDSRDGRVSAIGIGDGSWRIQSTIKSSNGQASPRSARRRTGTGALARAGARADLAGQVTVDGRRHQGRARRSTTTPTSR